MIGTAMTVMVLAMDGMAMTVMDLAMDGMAMVASLALVEIARTLTVAPLDHADQVISMAAIAGTALLRLLNLSRVRDEERNLYVSSD